MSAIAVMATAAGIIWAAPASGSVIAYSAGYGYEGLYTEIDSVDPDGHGAMPLVTPGAGEYAALQPDYSADGTRLIYSVKRGSYDGGIVGADLVVANADGSNPTALMHDPAYEFAPSFSPDGSWIAYERCLIGGSRCALMTANADGTDRTRLVGNAWDPDFSRTGIAFDRRGGIYMIQPDGTGLEKLIGPGKHRRRYAAHPEVSPTDRTVAFDRNGGRRHAGTHIWTMRLSGAHRHRLTSGNTYDTMPAFSPSGGRIVFTRNSPSDPFGATLAVMRADGGRRHALDIPGLWATWG
jgi:Tol biopolymer transport system component